MIVFHVMIFAGYYMILSISNYKNCIRNQKTMQEELEEVLSPYTFHVGEKL